jgi:hypothetical protein
MGSNSGGPMSVNSFAALSPLNKIQYPNSTQKKKRFAKIRQVIEGKK